MTSVWLLVTSIIVVQDGAPAAPSAQRAMHAAMEKQQAAAARQRESVRKQAENAGAWLMPGGSVSGGSTAPSGDAAAVAAAPPAEPMAQLPCDPIADISLTPMIDEAARAQSVEAKLLRAVIEQESAYRPCAVSSKGAKGLMQLMPDTAGELGVKDPFNPMENIEGGAKYLRQLLDKYKGDVSQALGAYNAGPTAVDQAGGVPNIRETRDYVKAILQKLAPTRTDPPSIPPPKPIEN
jgi:soluble lytic murein transglycosylase-like protein